MEVAVPEAPFASLNDAVDGARRDAYLQLDSLSHAAEVAKLSMLAAIVAEHPDQRPRLMLLVISAT